MQQLMFGDAQWYFILLSNAGYTLHMLCDEGLHCNFNFFFLELMEFLAYFSPFVGAVSLVIQRHLFGVQGYFLFLSRVLQMCKHDLLGQVENQI